MLLGLLEAAPEAEAGTAGLPDGAIGPFPDDLGGGDRGRFLKKEKSSEVCRGASEWRRRRQLSSGRELKRRGRYRNAPALMSATAINTLGELNQGSATMITRKRLLLMTDNAFRTGLFSWSRRSCPGDADAGLGGGTVAKTDIPVSLGGQRPRPLASRPVHPRRERGSKRNPLFTP